MDRANLMMFLDHPKTGKQIMSLQEAQEIMVRRWRCIFLLKSTGPLSPSPSLKPPQLNTGVTMDMYIIYCKLMRAGYIVQRCVSAT